MIDARLTMNKSLQKSIQLHRKLKLQSYTQVRCWPTL